MALTTSECCGCAVLVVWSLHKNERFDLAGCADFMISPCQTVRSRGRNTAAVRVNISLP